MFKSMGLVVGVLLGLALVYSPTPAVGWVERPASPDAKPTGIQPAPAITQVPEQPPEGVLGYYTADGGKTFIPIMEEKGVAERIPSGTTKEDFMAAHRMTAEAKAAIVHQEPLVPFVLDGVVYQPEQVHLFDGKQLGFTVGGDGRLYAFTSPSALENFMVEEQEAPLAPGWPPEYSVFYGDPYCGGSQQLGILPGVSKPDLGPWDNVFSSMDISAYARNGCTLFDLANYQGDYFAVPGPGKWDNLSQQGWNDRASSIIVWPQ